MDPEPSVIRQEINETRQSLTDKLETLENQVIGSVQQARDTVQETINTVKSTVSDTVDSVKSSVSGTVDSVKRTFDIRNQVQERPFICVGLTFAAGAIAGAMIKGSRHHRMQTNGHSNHLAELERAFPSRRLNGLESYNNGVPESAASFASEPEKKQHTTRDLFGAELDKVKGLALGTVMGLIRDLAKETLPPSFAPHVDEVMNSATTKLGGQPLARIIHSRQTS